MEILTLHAKQLEAKHKAALMLNAEENQPSE